MTKSSIVSTGLLLFLVLSVGADSGLAAQTRSGTAGARFTGLIVDREGVGIPGASIQIENNDRQWKVSSDRNGEFKLALPIASYRFTIERAGFKKLVLTDFMINVPAPIGHCFPMEVQNPIDIVIIKPATFSAALPDAPEPDPNIGVNGYFSNDKAQRGRTIQVGIVIEIPSGYHVNANRPLGKYAIPTTLKVEGPRGVTVGAVAYPRAIVRKLKAVNNESLAVYEGRAILRFNVTVPANYQGGDVSLKAHLRYQSCNDEVCFPPKNQDMSMGIDVVGANDRVQKVNGWVFGGKEYAKLLRNRSLKRAGVSREPGR